MYIVYRLHVTITYQTRPTPVQLNSNMLIHTLQRRHQCAIPIIRTVVPKDHPIHPLLSAKVLQDQAVTTIALTVHQLLARVLAIIAILQPHLVVCHMALPIAIIHIVSKNLVHFVRAHDMIRSLSNAKIMIKTMENFTKFGLFL